MPARTMRQLNGARGMGNRRFRIHGLDGQPLVVSTPDLLVKLKHRNDFSLFLRIFPVSQPG
jgi:hypothetical protein